MHEVKIGFILAMLLGAIAQRAFFRKWRLYVVGGTAREEAVFSLFFSVLLVGSLINALSLVSACATMVFVSITVVFSMVWWPADKEVLAYNLFVGALALLYQLFAPFGVVLMFLSIVVSLLACFTVVRKRETKSKQA